MLRQKKMLQNNNRSLKLSFHAIFMCAALGACGTMERGWDKTTSLFSDKNVSEITEPSNDSRIDVMSYKRRIMLDETALDDVQLSEAASVTRWNQEGGDATQQKGHIKGSLLQNISEKVTVGDGNDWIVSSHAPSPVLSEQAVIAMDGRGVVTAHQRGNIRKKLWRSATLKTNTLMLVGGLATNNQLVFASNGKGIVAALDIANGNVVWQRDLGFPLRSSLRYDRGELFILTASSELIALDAGDGSLLWQHRGSDTESGIFGSTLPAISSNSVLIGYPSGELYRLDRATGQVLWADIIQNSATFAAINELTGMDANPVITERLVVAGNSNGMMVADAAGSGRRLWQQELGITHAPWISDDALYAVSHDGNLSAHNASTGVMAWYKPLRFKPEGDIISARRYGPFLLNNTLVVLDNAGYIQQYSLQGAEIRYDELLPSIAASPAFIDDAAYLLSYGSTLYKVQ